MNTILAWESNQGLECLPLSESGYREKWEACSDKIQAKRMLTKIRGKFLDQYRLQNVSLYEEIMNFFALYTKNNRSAFSTAKYHLACLELIFQANLEISSFVNFSEKHKYYLEEYFSKLTHQPYRKISTSMHYIDLLVNYYQQGINPNLLLLKPRKPNKAVRVKNPNQESISFIYVYALQKLVKFDEAVKKRLDIRNKYKNSPLFTKQNLAMSLDYYYSCQEKTKYKTLILEFMGKILKIKDIWCLDKAWIGENKKSGENILKLRKEEELFRFFDCLLSPRYLRKYPSELNAIIKAICMAKRRTNLQNKILDSILPSRKIIYPLLTILLIRTGVNLESLLNAKRVVKTRKEQCRKNTGSQDDVFYFSSWKNRARKGVGVAINEKTEAYYFFDCYLKITQPFSSLFGNTYLFARHFFDVSKSTNLTSKELRLWSKRNLIRNGVNIITPRVFRDYYAHVCDMEKLGHLQKQLAMGHHSGDAQKNYESQALQDISSQAMRSLQERCSCQNIITREMSVSPNIFQEQNPQIPLPLQCFKCEHLCVLKTNHIAIIFLQDRLDPTHELQPILKDIAQRLKISDEERRHAHNLFRADPSLTSKITNTIQYKGE